MSERRLVDTNVVVRFLVRDRSPEVAAAVRIFDRCGAGDLTLILLPTVLAECVYVLESFYEASRAKIQEGLTALLSSPAMEIEGRATLIDSLRRYAESNMHFVDCLLAATAAATDVPVATFDRGFKKFADVTVDVS